jgi:two-component system NarL family sensor kinase
MRPFFLITLLVITGFSLPAQNRKIDSLENQLTTKLEDTVRATSMMRLAIEYEGVDTGMAAKYYRDAIAFASPKGLHHQLGRIYHNQAILFRTVGRYDAAQQCLDSALANLQKSTRFDAQLRIASVYDEFGNVARNLNDYKKAIDYRLKAIYMMERMNNRLNLVNAYLNLSGLYKDQGEFDKQELYAQKGLEQAKILNTADALFKGYSYVAFSLNTQGNFEKCEKYIDSAREYYGDSYPGDVLISFHLIAGLTYMNLAKLDKAKKEFSDCYVIAERYKSMFSMLQSRLQLSRVLALQKNFKEAEPLLLSAFEDAKKQNEASNRKIVLDYLSRLYDEKGDYKKALFYYKEYSNLYDSISSEENKQFVSSLEVQYETKKKEDQIGQLQADKKIQELSISRKNIINYILIGSAAVLLIVSLLIYRTYSQKQKLHRQRISELEMEKQLEATEAVLKGESQERTRLAKDLHDGLGGMLSGVKYSLNTMKGNLIMTPDNAQAFERSMDMLDSSIREIRRVAHNMMPEALVKFGLDTALRDFCNDIDKSGALKVKYQSLELENAAIDQTVSITIYRIVQELLNNTIKHAGATSAIVQVSKTADVLSVTVEDDGKGFDTSILNKTEGIGWANIQNRVEFLKGKMDVNSAPDKGTSVHIELGT